MVVDVHGLGMRLVVWLPCLGIANVGMKGSTMDLAVFKDAGGYGCRATLDTGVG